MRVRRRQIRETALGLWDTHGGANLPVDVCQIAKNLGIRIESKEVEQEFSGFLLRNQASQCVVIGVNSTHPPTRQRFTIAHEIGHFCLQHGTDDLRVDRGLLVVRNRDGRSATGTDIEEIEANLFAAELLMPAESLKADLEHGLTAGKRDDQLLEDLAEKYEVSVQALSIRASTLGYVLL